MGGGDMYGTGDYLPQDKGKLFAEALRSLIVRIVTIPEQIGIDEKRAREYVSTLALAKENVSDLEYRLAN